MYLSKQDVTYEAQRVREEYFPNDYSRDGLEEILEAHGGELVYVSNEYIQESLLIHANGSFKIFLPRNSSAVRDYFTIAHELGHYFLHWTKGTEESFCRGESNPIEWQANWFAAELLMPEQLFSDMAEEFDYDINDLSDYFGVSRSAASVRLDALELV